MKPTTLAKGISDRWPILAVFICSLASFTVLVFVHRSTFAWPDPRAYLTSFFLVPFALGIAYTHFFEYGYHRLLMHGGAPGLGFIKRNHLQHHRVFYGDNFTSRNRDDWRYIASPWFVFPGLLTVHYFALRPLASPRFLVAFFAGVLLHYLVFEGTHWLTHIEGNAVDRWVARLPVLAGVRDYHVRHHRYHHEIPTADFNFNPPFLGDVIFGTLKVPRAGEAPYSR